MSHTIKTITLAGVNCYLLSTAAGQILIDTAWPFKRAGLDAELKGAGCRPGGLNLIILTHGDFDHSGNAAYLRARYGARIAMHRLETEVVEKGDMGLNRKNRPVVFRLFFGLVKLYGRLTRFNRFRPDLTVEEGTDLSVYGLDARIVDLPGHSTGSIGVLTGAGDLLCGDLAMHDRPVVHSLIDDGAALKASVDRVKNLPVTILYPGHGSPFPPERLAGLDRPDKNRPDRRFP